jgi:predicted enzyme related to lactoylglutathione lyase
MSSRNNHIDYIEFKAKDLETIKLFYSEVFDWKFTDYGPTYVSFEHSGVAGGFEKTDDDVINGVLVVLYHSDLQSTKEKVINAGGKISKDIFSFPGGQRFEFTDPSGNELAVWSE